MTKREITPENMNEATVTLEFEMALTQQELSIPIRVFFQYGQFRVRIDMKAIEDRQDILAKLVSMGFQEGDPTLLKISGLIEAEGLLKALAQTFSTTSTNGVNHA